MTKAHVHFRTQKIKVRLAVQVFSDSCAKAIEYLCRTGLTEFSDSLATEMFLHRLDKMFDILNSRSVAAKGFKLVSQMQLLAFIFWKKHDNFY